MNQKYWYKIVEKEGETIKTLFHGVNKSRKLRKNEWLRAEEKLVKDGSSKTIYWSGWHIAKSYEDLKKYLLCFKKKKNKQIIKVEVEGRIWPKKHSRHDIFLCEWIKII